MIQEHPQGQLKGTWVNIIRSEAVAAERSGAIQPAQLQLCYDEHWFTMLAPTQYSGGARSLPAVVRLEEAIAWADGSMGWVVTLCSGAGWFGGFMHPALAEQVFSNPIACLAGSGAATGTAEVIAGGYRISGRWLHASGAPHNTVFTANCIITKEGKPVKNEQDEPVIKAFAFYRNEVKIINTWTAFGLIATASHAFEVNHLEVTEDRAFIIDEELAYIYEPLYRYPFLQLAEITLAANISGMAIHFIDEAVALAENKKREEQQLLKEAVEKAATTLNKLRTIFYSTIDDSWNELLHDNNVSANHLYKISDIAGNLAVESRKQIENIYPYCGLIAASTESTINRIWRDLHTASQHSLLVFPRN